MDTPQDARRSLLSDLLGTGGSRVAPEGSEDVTEALLKTPPWALDEIRWRDFLGRCKLSAWTMARFTERRMDILSNRRVAKGKDHYTVKRKRWRAQQKKTYATRRFITALQYYKLKRRARNRNVDCLTRDEFTEHVVDPKWLQKCPASISYIRQDPELGYVLGNLDIYEDGQLVRAV